MRVFRLLTVLLVLSVPAWAVDTNALDGKVAVSEDAVKDAEGLSNVMRGIATDLSDVDQKHFFTIYHTYALIGTVETVQSDVGHAVQACGEKNPELAEKMTTRFKEWKDAVAPVLKEAKGQVDNMVIAQEYAKPEALTKFLGQMDEVRAKTDNSLSKVPVTTADACEELYKTMDGTQDNLVSLLRETLVSVPRALSSKPESEQSESDQ